MDLNLLFFTKNKNKEAGLPAIKTASVVKGRLDLEIAARKTRI